ncbi:MAG: hypothetical protein AAFO77_11950 [Pseudomonadota bacterium]
MNAFFASLVGDALAPWVSGIVVALAVLIALWALAALYARYRQSVFVSGGRKNRLQVIDATAVDDRRRLVLVRRDDVEHLIMIGGNSDLVIEKGIGAELAEYVAQPQKSQVSHKAIQTHEAFSAETGTVAGADVALAGAALATASVTAAAASQLTPEPQPAPEPEPEAQPEPTSEPTPVSHADPQPATTLETQNQTTSSAAAAATPDVSADTTMDVEMAPVAEMDDLDLDNALLDQALLEDMNLDNLVADSTNASIADTEAPVELEKPTPDVQPDQSMDFRAKPAPSTIDNPLRKQKKAPENESLELEGEMEKLLSELSVDR